MTPPAHLRRLAKSATLRSWLAAALLCALFAAETFAVVHPLDLAAHSNGEPCKICVGIAGLGSAAAADTPLVAVVPSSAEAVPVVERPLFSVAPVRQTARGPPLPS